MSRMEEGGPLGVAAGVVFAAVVQQIQTGGRL